MIASMLGVMAISSHYIISHEMLTDFHNQLVKLSTCSYVLHIILLGGVIRSLVMVAIVSLVMCQTSQCVYVSSNVVIVFCMVSVV